MIVLKHEAQRAFTLLLAQKDILFKAVKKEKKIKAFVERVYLSADK